MHSKPSRSWLVPLHGTVLTAVVLFLAWPAPASIADSSPVSTAPDPAITSNTSDRTGQVLPTATEATGPVLTIDQAVTMALSHNPSVLLAQLKLENAIAQIDLTRAGGLPQVQASLVDTQSSQRSFSAAGGGSTSSVGLPNGGSIPVVVDQSSSTIRTPTSTSTAAAGSSSISNTSTGTASGTSQAVSASTGSLGESVPAVLTAYSGALSKAEGTEPVSHANPSGNTQSGGQYNNYSGKISFSQPLDVFGLVPAGLEVSALTRDFYQIDLERVSNEVALTTKTDFINVLRDQDSIATEQDQLEASNESLRTAQAQYSVGTIPEYDLLTAEANLSNVQQLLYSAQNQLDLDLASLNNVLGRQQNDTVTVQPPPLPPLNLKFNLSDLISTAYDKRPELLQANSNIEIARKLVRLNAAALYPSISLTGSGNYNGTQQPGTPQTTYSISADLGIPLYDGGATRSRVRSAEITVSAQEETLEQLKQNIALEVRQAYIATVNAQVRSSSAQDGVAEATEALRIANLRYQNQIGTLLDVTNAQAQLATARNNLSTAQHDYQTSLAQLLRAEGGR